MPLAQHMGVMSVPRDMEVLRQDDQAVWQHRKQEGEKYRISAISTFAKYKVCKKKTTFSAFGAQTPIFQIQGKNKHFAVESGNYKEYPQIVGLKYVCRFVFF